MMAWKAHEVLRNVGTDGQPTIVVLDNIQAYKRLWNPSLGREAQMIVGTGATAAQMEDCPPGAFELAPLLENCKQNKWFTLMIKALEKHINWVHIHAVKRFHWVDALIFYVPALAMHRDAFGHMFNDQTCKHQINPKRHTVVSMQGMTAALSNFLGQLGITEETYGRKLLFFTGDGKTFEGINKVKKLLSAQEGDFRSFQFVHAVLEIWHTKWTNLIRIFQCHWGTSHEVSDPSTLGYLAQATLSPIPDYLGTNNLSAFFESLAVANRLPCLTALLDDANILVKQYCTTDAYMCAPHPELVGGAWYSNAPIRPTWGIHGMNSSTTGRDIQLNLDKSVRLLGDLNNHGGALQSESLDTGSLLEESKHESPNSRSDWALVNNILLMRDGIWFLEVCHAVTLGDIGRVWEVLKGKAGKFHELDLTQEHFNKYLEEFAQHKGKEFGDKWYRDVLSIYIHNFMCLSDKMEKAVNLADRSLHHTNKCIDNKLRLVI
ncbi:hypothetical protein HETIRDRAFT_421218 [Heterobasidion irregulare TC 32-1]|uniref:DUF6589 domain-containing protein n=1 Tax=Heterobasidion irregulare (strain TC 32-1) TaxID=747525 RepID=W4JTX6_HETIT|nr:uncharacterized protein HETIRDRAFT_421218 [Heterobasidion irregulare TC 32-1]ETW77008.1 hypothetical protein HETIRDRAFT_421218 [Heterobasidion irregulare TC 32-1]